MQPTTATLLPSPMLDGFESISVNTESSASRRQRISMACQYCRHRKIRCCGAAPCRNCTRSGRQCEYTPVPEEVNRATREKKALSKTKPSTPATPSKPTLTYPAPSPAVPTFSPYLMDGPTFDMPYTLPVPPPHVLPSGPRPALSRHRRTSSAPSYESASWSIPPPAPLLNSPAQLESSAWMYNGWSAALPVPSIGVDIAPYTPTRAFPSVLEQTPLHNAYLSHTPAVSSPLAPQHYQMMSNPMPSVPTMPNPTSFESDYSYNWSIPPFMPMPVAPSPYLLPPAPMSNKGLNIQTSGFALSSPPITPTTYYTPYATPSLYSSAGSSAGNSSTYTPSPPAYSPTLAPEPSSKKELFGLGLGMPAGAIENDVFYTPTLPSGEYFSY